MRYWKRFLSAALVLISSSFTTLSVAAESGVKSLVASHREAEKDLETMRAELQRLQSNLSRAEGLAASRRAELKRERDDLLKPLEERLAIAMQAVEEAKGFPIRSEEELAAKAAVEAAENARKVALELQATAMRRALDTGGQIAMLRVRLESLEQEITAARQKLNLATAKHSRISIGDPDALMDAARAAEGEKEALLQVFFEFEPEFQTALKAPRMLLSMHLPTLFKIKEKLEAIETAYCGIFAVNLHRYVKTGFDGLREFASDAKSVLASVYVEMAMRHKPDPEDAKECDMDIALSALADASDIMEEASVQFDALAAEMATIESRLPELEAALPKHQAEVQEMNAEVQRAKDALVAVKKDVENQRPWFEEATKLIQAERDARIGEATVETNAIRAEIQDLNETFNARLSASEPSSEIRKQIAKMRSEISAKERKRASLRDALMLARFRDELSSSVRIETDIENDAIGWSACVRVINKSRFAIKSLTVSLNSGGVDISETAEVDVFQRFGFASSALRNIKNLKATSLKGRSLDDRTLRMTFSGTNDYMETVPYLLADQTSSWGCSQIDRNILTSDSLRRLEAAGVDNPRKWRFSLVDLDHAAVALAKRDTERAGALIFNDVSPSSLYGDLTGSNSEGIASTPPSGPTDTGRATSGFSPTRKQIREVQTRLNRLGFDAGTPDGLIGRNTRNAIERFQLSKGLQADGQLTEQLMAAVMAPPTGENTARFLVPNIATQNLGLTADEMDRLRSQLSRCWLVPAGAMNADNLIVEVEVSLNSNGTVRSAQVVDRRRMQSDPFFRSAAESALRALKNPDCSPLEIPRRTEIGNLKITFNPAEMLN